MGLMDLVTIYTVNFLQFFAKYCGGFGMAIIILTVIVRLCLWHSSVAQQRSMRKMQALQPKMKAIQERYKNNPQVMQQKMMEFYKENKFNPMGGCFPILIQLPIFICLYSALISPLFIQVAGDSNFLFIKRLDANIKGVAGRSYDGTFSAHKTDQFVTLKNIKVYMTSDETGAETELDNVKIKERNPLKIQGEIIPGEPIDFKISLDALDLRYSQLEKVKALSVDIQDRTTREVENVKFERNGDILTSSMPTAEVTDKYNKDVIILVILFGLTMILTQKVMMATTKKVSMDPKQEEMQKMMGNMMPIMVMVMFIWIQVPAGVLLYLVVSNIFQIIQTIIINKQLELEEANQKASKNIDLSNAQPATIKEDPKAIEDKK